MGEDGNATLAEFLEDASGAGGPVDDAERTDVDDAEGGEPTPAGSDDATPADEPTLADEAGPDDDARAVEPVTASYAPDTGSCAGCGESAVRLWREGDAFVCAACKDW